MYSDKDETKISEEFIQNGYIVADIENKQAYEDFLKPFLQHLSLEYTVNRNNLTEWLNNVHKVISPENLNNFRLNIIQTINNDKNFRESYYRLAKPLLDIIVGNELAMQRRVNLSIQLPEDSSSLLHVHADTWSGDSPFEVVAWVPIVDCYGTKTMFILPPNKSGRFYDNYTHLQKEDSESLFKFIEDDLKWIDIKAGQILLFNQTLPHGNRVNKENETRWSLNCRFKGLFTPYADKKLGEFFEPITTKPASLIGLNYRLPK